MPAPSEKFLFADQLRGVAAVLVLISHMLGSFWFARGVVATFLFAPPLASPTPSWVAGLAAVPVNPGALGVAIFFMVSGFVIPFSFRTHGTVGFLGARLLRIYPVYWVALGAGLAVRYGSACYWGQPFRIGPYVLLSNALLVNDLVGVGSIDLVNWTLAIELKFYLLYALTRHLVLRWRGWLAVACGAMTVGLSLTATLLLPLLPFRAASIVTALTNEAMLLPFMLLGSLLALHVRGQLSAAAVAVTSATVLLLMALAWRVGPDAAAFVAVAPNYVLGWAIFAACTAARHRFAPRRSLRVLASISYPLYLVHSAVGYAVLRVMIDAGTGVPMALVLAIALSAGLAIVIHQGVERRSVALGRRLALRPADGTHLAGPGR